MGRKRNHGVIVRCSFQVPLCSRKLLLIFKNIYTFNKFSDMFKYVPIFKTSNKTHLVFMFWYNINVCFMSTPIKTQSYIVLFDPRCLSQSPFKLNLGKSSLNDVLKLLSQNSQINNLKIFIKRIYKVKIVIVS